MGLINRPNVTELQVGPMSVWWRTRTHTHTHTYIHTHHF